jgi:hypothetical protein
MSATETKFSRLSQLIYSRKQTAKLLGNVSTATIRRLEAAGRLRGFRLNKSKSASVFFRAADIDAFLIEACDDQ